MEATQSLINKYPNSDQSLKLYVIKTYTFIILRPNVSTNCPTASDMNMLTM